ncbi:hypothetical protein RFI_03972 [Reticulomyxa filosa]|uniref:Uncharacterized protein n=1 Tax=Reticulomyxa filosa TaxID=46433 RepID=X6P4J8_RETFI|nr:hypothetical protein RFI_03972 [Reticulomyxa filosa]|eukprot:ETO33136.1 hypothetical protein RFI_03972 [Reticulomyxa filosa]
MKLHFDFVTQLLQSMRQEIEWKDKSNETNRKRFSTKMKRRIIIKSLEERNFKLTQDINNYFKN